MNVALPIADYVAKMEALGLRFRACRRAGRRELHTTFPVIWPSECDAVAGRLDDGHELALFEFIAERDGVTTLPPVGEVVRPNFGARARTTPSPIGGDAA